MFWTVPLSIIRSFYCTHSNGTCHTGLLTEELSKTCGVSFQNKCEKLMHLVGFIVRYLSRCTVT